MFAEDVGLLPDKMFERLIKLSRPKPETFAEQANKLFAAMRIGGDVGFERVEWFNGGLFKTIAVPQLDILDVTELRNAADPALRYIVLPLDDPNGPLLCWQCAVSERAYRRKSESKE